MRGALGTAALGLALVAVAGLFDAEPLLVGGIALVALAAAGATWVALAARTATLSRELDSRRVAEDEPVTVRLRARTSLPFPGGSIEEPLLASPAALPAGGRAAALRIEARFVRRGRRVLAPPTLVLRDPLGIARRELAGGEAAHLLVLPRIEPVASAPGAGPLATSRRSLAAVLRGEWVDPDGLRPYLPGAPASRIHWPAYARGAGLLERRLAGAVDARPLVVLDSRDPPGEAALDAVVRAAASLCLELARRGGCAILLPAERRARQVGSDLGAWPAVWAALALVEPGAAPSMSGLGSRPGRVIYVSARGAASLPPALSRGAGAAVLVAPAEAAGPPGSRPVLEVAGCRGHLLGARAAAAA